MLHSPRVADADKGNIDMFGHDNQDTTHTDKPADADSHQAEQQIVASAAEDNDVSSEEVTTSSSLIATPVAPINVPAAAATDDLLDIKQKALQELTPLVGQLDQTPEEQFRTTMMMIQASDNHSLVQVAYQAAQRISNEKERAQALLDIVNEINYFTQHVQA